jgi:hypothetical protein
MTEPGRSAPATADADRPRDLHFRLFGQFQSVVDLDAKASHGAFDAMTEE